MGCGPTTRGSSASSMLQCWLQKQQVTHQSSTTQPREAGTDILNLDLRHGYVEGNISDKDYRMWFKLNC